jgi:hypothetical protein
MWMLFFGSFFIKHVFDFNKNMSFFHPQKGEYIAILLQGNFGFKKVSL